jgi:hypothetical protein
MSGKRIYSAFTILMALWTFFYIKDLFVVQVTRLGKDLAVFFLPIEIKHRMIDDEFYAFMQFCKRNTPENAEIGFENIKYSLEQKYTLPWMRSNYYSQKLPYYLYPRKIYSDQTVLQEEPMYRIIYDGENEIPSFKLLYKDQVMR